MTAEFQRVPVSVLAALKREPAMVARYLIPEPGGPREARVDIDGVLYSLPQYSLEAVRALPGARQRKSLLWLRRTGVLIPIREAPEKERTVSSPPRPRARALNIDKAWHGLHYLLSGRAEPTRSPLGRVILGGRPLGSDMGYGPCRFLTAHQVGVSSAALSRMNVDAVRGRFDARTMVRSKIYPGAWDNGDLKSLVAAFRQLRRYYAQAAAHGEAMLIYLV